MFTEYLCFCKTKNIYLQFNNFILFHTKLCFEDEKLFKKTIDLHPKKCQLGLS